MRYVYSVVRFVPDTIRDERINIGLVIGSDDTSEWELRMLANSKRARAIDDNHVLASTWDFVDDIGRQLDAYTEAMNGSERPAIEISETWLKNLSIRACNVVQLSQPTPVAAGSLREAFDVLTPQFLLEPERRASSHTNKQPALAALRRAYRELDLKKGEHVAEKAIVHGANHQEVFDFVVANGRIGQLAQAFSFQVVDPTDLTEKVKAWAWTVSDIRRHGGEAQVSEHRRVEVSKDVDIAVVYVPPASDSPYPNVLLEALSAFGEVQVEAAPVDDALVIARRAADAISH